MKTIFFKLLLLVTILINASNALAYNKALPPFTNEEINEYASELMSNNLHQRAKSYYLELKKRREHTNSTWGLALVDIAEQKNLDALKKINSLLNNKDVQIKKLTSLKAQLLIALAEEYYEKNNIPKAKEFLNEYQYVANEYKKDHTLKHRANYLQGQLNHNATSRTKINVGVILPLTGKFSTLGKEIQKALILTMYNKKLSNINLYFEDNQSSQEGSITAATNIISKSPSLVIGPILRDNVLAANSVIINTRIPMFALSNDESIARGNVFINNSNIKQEARQIARFAVDDRRINLSCLTPDTNYGSSQQKAFMEETRRVNGFIRNCEKFDSSRIDINKSLKKLLNIDALEKKRLAELKRLEREFKQLGNAMDDEKIQKMEDLKEPKEIYDVDFNGIFIPISGGKLTMIAPQLAFYDVDFSNNVLFLGTSSWDNDSILKSNGEHLHFSRFLSLKTKEYMRFEKLFAKRYKSKPKILSGFASDILYIAQQITPHKSIYSQIYRPYGFGVLTGNVRFNKNNMPERIYGISKISRRKIKQVTRAKHQRPIELPRNLEIRKTSVFNNWFGFN